MAIVDTQYKAWQADFEASMPHLFDTKNSIRAVAERRDLMRMAYMAGKSGARQSVGDVKPYGWIISGPVGTPFFCPDSARRVMLSNVTPESKEIGITVVPLYAAPPAQQAVDLGPCNCHPETCCCPAKRRRFP